MESDNIKKFVREFVDNEVRSLFGGLSFTTSATSTNIESTLKIEDIQKAWGLVKDIPRLPFDEVWMHSKAELPEFVKVEQIGEGDERFFLHSISGIPVLLKDSLPKNIMFCCKQGNILKGELPSIVMVVDLEESNGI